MEILKLGHSSHKKTQNQFGFFCEKKNKLGKIQETRLRTMVRNSDLKMLGLRILTFNCAQL